MQQMALIKGFTESRSASRKRLKHEQGMAWHGFALILIGRLRIRIRIQEGKNYPQMTHFMF
jgi:hypothetical protein